MVQGTFCFRNFVLFFFERLALNSFRTGSPSQDWGPELSPPLWELLLGELCARWPGARVLLVMKMLSRFHPSITVWLSTAPPRPLPKQGALPSSLPRLVPHVGRGRRWEPN